MSTAAAEMIRETCAAVIAAKFPSEPEPGLLAPWSLNAKPAFLDMNTGVGLSEFILNEGKAVAP